MSLAAEEQRIRSLFEHVEQVEAVAETMPETDARRSRLLASARGVLTQVDPIRPRIAALLLRLSERTIRTWATEGVLTAASTSSRRLVLDPERVHEVMHVVRELRQAGRDRNLLEAVWHRLSDQALRDREDLSESITQMRRGEGRVLYPLPSDDDAEAA